MSTKRNALLGSHPDKASLMEMWKCNFTVKINAAELIISCTCHTAIYFHCFQTSTALPKLTKLTMCGLLLWLWEVQDISGLSLCYNHTILHQLFTGREFARRDFASIWSSVLYKLENAAKKNWWKMHAHYHNQIYLHDALLKQTTTY